MARRQKRAPGATSASAAAQPHLDAPVSIGRGTGDAYSLSSQLANLQRTPDELVGLAGPEGVRPVYAFATDLLAQAQAYQYVAAATEASADDAALRDSLAVVAQTQFNERARAENRAAAVHERHRELTTAAGNLVRRTPQMRLLYKATTAMLYAGDVAGGVGAAVLLGEIWWVSLLQMTAVGAAAVTTGRIGAHEGNRRRALQLQAAGALEGSDLQHLVTPTGDSDTYLRRLYGGALLVAVCIAVAMLMLRSTDSILLGLAYGLWAMTIPAASFISSFLYADPVADLLEASQDAVTKAEHAVRAVPDDALRQHAEAASRVESTMTAARYGGVAAALETAAATPLAMTAKPQFFGHYLPADTPNPGLPPSGSVSDAETGAPSFVLPEVVAPVVSPPSPKEGTERTVCTPPYDYAPLHPEAPPAPIVHPEIDLRTSSLADDLEQMLGGHTSLNGSAPAGGAS